MESTFLFVVLCMETQQSPPSQITPHTLLLPTVSINMSPFVEQQDVYKKRDFFETSLTRRIGSLGILHPYIDYHSERCTLFPTTTPSPVE